MPTLKQHRLRKVWTIRDLAAEAGVSQQSIVKAEAGKMIRLGTMKKMARALDVDPWEVAEFADMLEQMGEVAAVGKLAA